MKKVVFFLFFSVCSLINLHALECSDLAKKESFKTTPNDLAYTNEGLFYCDGSLLNLKEVKELFETSIAIRSESQSCVGDRVYKENLNKLRWLLLKASFVPELYQKELAKPEVAESEKDARMEYLRYWANESLFNFLKYKKFIEAYKNAQTPLVKFYESLGLDTPSAAYYATSVVNEFLTFGVGKNVNKAKILTPEQNIMAQRINSDELANLLYSKNFSTAELTNLLNIALLNEKSSDMIKEIIRRGADVNLGDETPLFFALKNIENVKILLANKADVNHKNFFGKSVLFYAVQFSDKPLCELLLKNGANANESYIDENAKMNMINLGMTQVEDTCGLEHTNRSVFMHAAAHATPEILKLLMDNGADINATDDAGFNALDYAMKEQNEKTIKFLENLGLKPNFN
ncbi:ankyrin repeat domain-containing protein [Campylobacter concisus]|uniref:ankyrin repeat domain-containing protein n=1 Tax=Campylobacter concisus TaxID=199 RepID=UPI0018836A15|nr:ankyrin repeat domain-containing protein [Campylobacter concisus]MBE9828538.1 ankyrin repeat domain-containing protein [Campylobacter concisus]